MIRTNDGDWREASWADALQTVAEGLTRVKNAHGAASIGAIGSPMATVEELALLARVTRGLGSANVDFRLRQTDSGLDETLTGIPWLGMSIEQLNTLDRVLVIGADLRAEHPLLAQRLRQATRHGAQISLIGSFNEDPLFAVKDILDAPPSQLPQALAEVAVALARLTGTVVPAELEAVSAGEHAQIIAASLVEGLSAEGKVAVLLGNLAMNSPQASAIAAHAQKVAELAGSTLGFLTAGGNTVGGYLAAAVPNAIPGRRGLSAEQMLAGEQNLQAFIVLHAEPALDTDNGGRAVQTLKAAAFSVALTSYASAASEWADVMLPVAPFTETSGTFVNVEGRAQSFKGTAAPHGESRPAWKVLRVLGNLLELPDFDEETSEAVRDGVLGGKYRERLSNQINGTLILPAQERGDSLEPCFERVADVPIYRSDALVRRAEPLQQTRASRPPRAGMNAATLAKLGLADGELVKVGSNAGEIILPAQLDVRVANGVVRISAAFAQTLPLGSAFGLLKVAAAENVMEIDLATTVEHV